MDNDCLECEQFTGRKRAICRGEANIPMSGKHSVNSHRQHWGLKPLNRARQWAYADLAETLWISVGMGSFPVKKDTDGAWSGSPANQDTLGEIAGIASGLLLLIDGAWRVELISDDGQTESTSLYSHSNEVLLLADTRFNAADPFNGCRGSKIVVTY